MNQEERLKIRKVVQEMKQAHEIIKFWLKDTPIEVTLASWITNLEELINE